MEIVKPKVLGFICTTAHSNGCRENVRKQIDFIKSNSKFKCKKNVLIVGSSTGYGLAARIATAFGGGAATIGVMLEKKATTKRTATAGWYNTAAFEEFANADNLYAKTINGDAFSNETIEKTVKLIKSDLEKIDLLIYSLAAPRRILEDGRKISSVLKTTKENYTNKTINLNKKTIENITIEKATEEEIENTIKVMGGENWKNWIFKLNKAGVLANDTTTIAFSYIGPKLTFPIYKDGTIGKAKDDLFKTATEINKNLNNTKAFISVNKALVTQASAAIPIVPLYLTILYRIMKKYNLHEGCIEQMYRLFSKKLNEPENFDENGRIRLDDFELKPKIQKEVENAWNSINNENMVNFTDIDGYFEDFYKMFGFGISTINYNEKTRIDVSVPSILKNDQ